MQENAFWYSVAKQGGAKLSLDDKKIVVLFVIWKVNGSWKENEVAGFIVFSQ